MSTHSREMIEITVQNTSPWKSVMADALEKFLNGWGYETSHVRNGNQEIFIGIERRPR